jgi:hypothetical protein
MKKLLLALTLITFTQASFASLLIEPFFGMAVNGELENGSYDDTYSGNTMGARLGWQNLGLQLGVDYRISTFDADDIDDDLKKTDISAFVGYEFPIMFRVYGAMQIAGGGEIGSTDYSEGSQTILGFGYTALPFVALNFEMVNWSYDKYDNGLTDGDTDLEGSHYLLSISVPFNL